MANKTSPELEACLKEKQDLENTRKKEQDDFSNDMQDASVVQADGSNQQAELKNAIDDYVSTMKEWNELKVSFMLLTKQYNELSAQLGPLSVRYKGCKDAIAAAAAKK